MADWNCESKTLNYGGKLYHGRTAGDKKYGIQIKLQAVSVAEVAAVEIKFRQDWGKATIPSAQINAGSFLAYEDPEGVWWRIYCDATHHNPAQPAFSTADMRVCYEETAAPAEGQIVSIDVPESAKAGQILETYTTIKNIGGTKAKFLLRFYDGATLVHEGLAGWIDPGQTIVDRLENPTMPDHTWNGRVDLIRVV